MNAGSFSGAVIYVIPRYTDVTSYFGLVRTFALK